MPAFIQKQIALDGIPWLAAHR